MAIGKDKVNFSAKDYRHAGKHYALELSQAEFIRRFVLHILPEDFVRIRHYGLLSSYHKRVSLTGLKAHASACLFKRKTAHIKGKNV